MLRSLANGAARSQQQSCLWAAATTSCSVRSIKSLDIAGQGGSPYLNRETKRAGLDELVRHTELYDGFTDDHGVFKEGPPTTLRLEYLRSPQHEHTSTVNSKETWSPFQADSSMHMFSPLYYDSQSFEGKDYYGHHSGTNPGEKRVLGHYEFRLRGGSEPRVSKNYHHIRRTPKWLACIVNYKKTQNFVGFFLYANGVYVAELLTYKQLPRLVYNKPFQSSVPTIGQTIDLGEVTYGKAIHSVEKYPGMGGVFCRASGTSATVMRGSEPNLVPLLLPSKEIRLFDNSCLAVFGRRAGVQYRGNRFTGSEVHKYTPKRPQVHAKSKPVSVHPAGGGNGYSWNLQFSLDWRLHPRNAIKSKYWLSGYIIRGRQYQKHSSLADIKAKTYSWASRDKVYR